MAWTSLALLRRLGVAKKAYKCGGYAPRGSSSATARLRCSGGKRTVIDGSFPETTELVAGCWIILVTSTAEAIEWASRVPFTDDEVIEVRQVLEASDFPPEILPPEATAREQAWRDEQQRKAAKP